MSFSAFAGLCLTLAIVLGLLAITLRWVRKMATAQGRVGGATQKVSLEVVQRLPLGPRQGIAVVRIGEQLVAVSVGEGGVRPIVEIDTPPVGEVAAGVEPHHEAFLPALTQRLRAAGVLGALCVAVSVASPAEGQRPAPSAQPTATSTARTGTASATPRTTPNGAPASSALDKALGGALPTIDLNVGQSAQGLRLSGSVGVVIMLGLLTLLPSVILLMTSFTRILIVLNFVKQALGTQTAPPGQLIAALSLVLTGFVMAPTTSRINKEAIQPWLSNTMEQGAMMQAAIVPMREFMLRQVRERDLATFVELSGTRPAAPEQVSTVVLMSAFVTSELRTAFQLGFVLFLPFIVIDVVVSSVLMSMGMFMLPPAMISLPFKLLLFVLVDGWSLLIQSLVQGFR